MHQYSEIILVALTFTIAGMVKGVTGMGLPTVSMGLLGLMMSPAEAAALLAVPSLITNVWQFVAGGNRLAAVRRLWMMLVAIALATWASAGLITGSGTKEATVALGVALVLYALSGLAKLRLHIPKRAEIWLSPVVGALTGVVTGATGVFVIPAVPYIQALSFAKDDLIQALGLSFTVSTIALTAALAARGVFHPAAVGWSFACTVPALTGMYAGQYVRMRVDAQTFRLIFFCGLLVLGCDLIVANMTAAAAKL